MSPWNGQTASLHLLIRYLPSQITGSQLRDAMRERWSVDPAELELISNIIVLRGYTGLSASVPVPSTVIVEISPSPVPHSQHAVAKAIIEMFDGKIVFPGEAASSVEMSPVPSMFPQLMPCKRRQKKLTIAGTIEESEAYKNFCARLNGDPIESEQNAVESNGKENENKETAVEGNEKPLTALVETLLARDKQRLLRKEPREETKRKKRTTILTRGEGDSQSRGNLKKKKTTNKTKSDPAEPKVRRRDEKSGLEGDVEEKVRAQKKERRRRKPKREEKKEVEKKGSRKEGSGAKEKKKGERDTKRRGGRGAKTGVNAECDKKDKRGRAPRRKIPQVRILARPVSTAD